MDTKEKTVWVKSRGIRNQQVGNTREVPAHGEYSDREGLTGKKKTKKPQKTPQKIKNRLQTFRNMLGCQSSSEKQQLNSNSTEEFGLSYQGAHQIIPVTENRCCEAGIRHLQLSFNDSRALLAVFIIEEQKQGETSVWI